MSSNCVGAISQLVAQGHLNKYLNSNPNVTFFRFQAMRHTMFALENIKLDFEGGSNHIGNNQSSSVRLHRSGDLVYHMYAVIDLPGIANVSTQKIKDTENTEGNSGELLYHEAVTDGLVDDYRSAGMGHGSCLEESKLEYVLPSGHTQTASGVAAWTDSVGQYLIKEATVFIGSQPIDTLYSDYMYIYEELQGKPGRRLLEMVGKVGPDGDSAIDSMFFRRLYVPLPFFFCKSSGCALPLVSLQFHDVRIKISWNGVSQAIVCSSGLGRGVVQTTENQTTSTAGTADTKVKFRTVVRPGQASMNDSTFQHGSLAKWGRTTTYQTSLPDMITDTAVRAHLECTYIYLDVQERAKFAEGSFEVIMDEVQALPVLTDQKSQTVTLNLNFNHAVIELYWACRMKFCESLSQHFDFSGLTEPITGRSLDAIRTVDLRLNNQCRFAQREGKWFRLVAPWQSHTNVPDSKVYCYSFALNPEDAQPSGSCNFSRIDNAELRLDVDKYMFQDNSNYGGLNFGSSTVGTASEPIVPVVTGGNSVSVIVYARNWNVLRVTLGLAGKAFAN